MIFRREDWYKYDIQTYYIILFHWITPFTFRSLLWTMNYETQGKKTYGIMSIAKSLYHSEHLQFKLKIVKSYMPLLCKDSNLLEISIQEKHLTPHSNEEDILSSFLKPLHVMFYRPFDSSMGLWIIDQFLKCLQAIFPSCGQSRIYFFNMMKHTCWMCKINNNEVELHFNCIWKLLFKYN